MKVWPRKSKGSWGASHMYHWVAQNPVRAVYQFLKTTGKVAGVCLCLMIWSGLILGSIADKCSAQSKWATPAQIEGPYYPKTKPEEIDSNLLKIGKQELAEGMPLKLEGKIFDQKGRPIVGAKIEIWQCDNNGIYNHPKAPNRDRFDSRFQGFGSSLTDLEGYFGFLTIMPVADHKRPPHIHVKIYRENREALTTQLYLKDHPENNRDGLLSLMLYPGQKKLLIDPIPSKLDHGLKGQSAWFDFVLAKNF